MQNFDPFVNPIAFRSLDWKFTSFSTASLHCPHWLLCLLLRVSAFRSMAQTLVANFGSKPTYAIEATGLEEWGGSNVPRVWRTQIRGPVILQLISSFLLN
jgi:hypothetical protein